MTDIENTIKALAELSSSQRELSDLPELLKKYQQLITSHERALKVAHDACKLAQDADAKIKQLKSILLTEDDQK
jgi:hypothetical protein